METHVVKENQIMYILAVQMIENTGHRVLRKYTRYSKSQMGNQKRNKIK